LSTEDLFTYLARQFKPTRLLLAGLEAGVWADFPQRTRLIAQIKPVNFPAIEDALGGSIAVDVTGGMASKVRQMLALAQDVPDLEVLIFSAEEPGLLSRVLTGETAGTQILGQ
jgi:isopentenyl phosphate kinase